MRAIVVRQFGEPDECRLEDDVPTPLPGPGEVVVAAEAAAVNFPDLLLVRGKYQDQQRTPFTPGKEVVGRVVSVGAGVASPRIGERVLAVVPYGGFAEQVRAAAIECYPVPDALDSERAVAAGIAYLTAWFALYERGGYRPGETVLVTGASGGVGMAALQIVKSSGGVPVAGVTSMAKADFCRSNGAEHIVDLSGAIDKTTIRRQLAGLGLETVDLVIEMLGGDAFDAAIRALPFRGRLVCIGFAAGGIIPTLPVNQLLLKGIAVTGFRIIQYRTEMVEESRRNQAEIFSLVLAGKLDPRIMHTYPLEEARQAIEAMRDRKVQGKLVLKIAR